MVSTRQGEAGTVQGEGRDSKGDICHVGGVGSGGESGEGSAQTDSQAPTGGAGPGADSDQTSSHLSSPASSLSCRATSGKFQNKNLLTKLHPARDRGGLTVLIGCTHTLDFLGEMTVMVEVMEVM